MHTKLRIAATDGSIEMESVHRSADILPLLGPLDFDRVQLLVFPTELDIQRGPKPIHYCRKKYNFALKQELRITRSLRYTGLATGTRMQTACYGSV